MNPITIYAKELKSALVGLSKIINKRAVHPFNHIRIERTGTGEIELTASDLKVRAVVRLDTPTQGEHLALLLPFDDLSNVAKSCGKEDVLSIAPVEENRVAIKFPVGGQIIEHQCELRPAEEFPMLPDVKGDAIPLEEPVRIAIQNAFGCASVDPTRPILNGVFLDVTNPQGHHAVATDGKHLLSSNSFVLPLSDSLTIPRHRFLDWREFKQDGPWRLRVETVQDEAPRFEIVSNRWRFSSPSAEGQYPNWRAVVPDPDSARTTLQFDPDTLGDVIQAIARIPCHNASHHTIGLEIAGQRCWLLGKSPSAEEWTRIEIPVSNVNGSGVVIFCNRQLLAKALRFGLSQVGIVDPSTPLRFSRGGQQMVIMPVLGERYTSSARMSVTPTPEPTVTPPRHQLQSNTEIETLQSHQPMKKTRDSRETPEPQPALDAALRQIDSLKVQYRETLRGLNGLNALIKEATREQRASEKEIHTVRQTLRSLQSVRI